MCVVEAQSLGRGVTLGQGLLPVDEAPEDYEENEAYAVRRRPKGRGKSGKGKGKSSPTFKGESFGKGKPSFGFGKGYKGHH